MLAKKACRLLGIIFSVVGAVVLAMGLFLYARDMRDFAAGEKVTATVDSVRVHQSYSRTSRSGWTNDYDVYVSYEYQGKRYDHIRLTTTSGSMYEGQQIELLINPDDPGEVTPTWGPLFILALLGGLGGTFLIVGVVLLVIVVRKGKSWEDSERMLDQSMDQMRSQGLGRMGDQPPSGRQVTTTTTTTTYTSDGREVRREVTTTSTTGSGASTIPSEPAAAPSAVPAPGDPSSPSTSEGPTSNPPTFGWGDSL